MTTTAPSLTIRLARDADAEAVRGLAALDEAGPLHGQVLLAEVDGRPVATVEIASGVTVADPFVASGEAASVLRMRAAQLRAPSAPRRALLRRARLRIASG